MLASTIQAYYFNNSSEIRHDSIQGGVHPWSFCSYLKQRLLSRSTGCFQMHFVSVALNKKDCCREERSSLNESIHALSVFLFLLGHTHNLLRSVLHVLFAQQVPSTFSESKYADIPLQIHNSFKREALGQRIGVSEIKVFVGQMTILLLLIFGSWFQMKNSCFTFNSGSSTGKYF